MSSPAKVRTEKYFLRKAFQFFLKHGGYYQGHRAHCALLQAKAELEASARGWTYGWKPDEIGELEDYLGDHKSWCPEARRKAARETWPRWNIFGVSLGMPDEVKFAHCTHEAFVCILKDMNGEVLGSLGGILDPDSYYRRVIEADLAIEALQEVHVHA